MSKREKRDGGCGEADGSKEMRGMLGGKKWIESYAWDNDAR